MNSGNSRLPEPSSSISCTISSSALEETCMPIILRMVLRVSTEMEPLFSESNWSNVRFRVRNCSSSSPQVSTSSNQSSLSLMEDADGAAADEAEERREEPPLSMADDGRKTTDVRQSDKISPSPLSPSVHLESCCVGPLSL